jgi:pimeloyl-ACP methyl ester carboxylesterase
MKEPHPRTTLVTLRSVSLGTALFAALASGCGAGLDDGASGDAVVAPEAEAAASQPLTTAEQDGACVLTTPPGVFKCTSFSQYRKCTGLIETSPGEGEGVAPVRVNTDVYLPTTGNDLPLLVLQHGGGGDKSNVGLSAVGYAKAGYAVMALTARGLGGTDPSVCSTGTADLVDPDGTGEDVIQALRWIALSDETAFSVRIDTMNVGVGGGSYGGLQAWVAGAMKHQGEHYHVRAIAPGATGVDLRSITGVPMAPRVAPLSLLALKCTLVNGLLANAAGGSPLIEELYAALNADDVSQQDAIMAEAKRRSVAWLGCDAAEGCEHDPLPSDLAVLMVHSPADGVFPARESQAFFERIRGGHLPSERKLVLGGFAHPSGYSTWRLLDGIDPYFSSVERAFFDCNLRANKNNACASSYFASPVSAFVFGGPSQPVDLDAFAPATNELQLDQVGGKLVLVDGTPATTLGEVVVTNSLEGDPGSLAVVKAPGTVTVVADGPTLAAATDWIGTGEVALQVLSNAPEFALSVHVYDAFGFNWKKEKLVTRGVYWFDGAADPAAVRSIVVPLELAAYRFAAGHRIRVKLSSIDKFVDSGTSLLAAASCDVDTQAQNDPSLHLWTLPSYVSSTERVSFGSSRPARIRMPLNP